MSNKSDNQDYNPLSSDNDSPASRNNENNPKQSLGPERNAPSRWHSLRFAPLVKSNPSTTATKKSGSTASSRTTYSVSCHLIDRLLENNVSIRTKAHEQLNICPCTQFGFDREMRYPHHFFCHECSLWEHEALSGNLSRIDPISRRWRCHASHEVGSIFPTQGQRHHHSLISPGEFNGQEPGDAVPVPPGNLLNYEIDEDYLVFGHTVSNPEQHSDDDESNKSSDKDESTNKPSLRHFPYPMTMTLPTRTRES